jgi:hypothetical protein
MRRRTQAEMDAARRGAGFEKLEQRIDEWGIFTVSLARCGAAEAMTAIAVDRTAGRAVAPGRAWLAAAGTALLPDLRPANWLASQRSAVPARWSSMGAAVPFLAWTIVPYWTINAFYGAVAVPLPHARRTGRHGRRLLTAQLSR